MVGSPCGKLTFLGLSLGCISDSSLLQTTIPGRYYWLDFGSTKSRSITEIRSQHPGGWANPLASLLPDQAGISCSWPGNLHNLWLDQVTCVLGSICNTQRKTLGSSHAKRPTDKREATATPVWCFPCDLANWWISVSSAMLLIWVTLQLYANIQEKIYTNPYSGSFHNHQETGTHFWELLNFNKDKCKMCWDNKGICACESCYLRLTVTSAELNPHKHLSRTWPR